MAEAKKYFGVAVSIKTSSGIVAWVSDLAYPPGFKGLRCDVQNKNGAFTDLARLSKSLEFENDPRLVISPGSQEVALFVDGRKIELGVSGYLISGAEIQIRATEGNLSVVATNP